MTNFKEKFKNKISVVNKNGTHTKIIGGETYEQTNGPPSYMQQHNIRGKQLNKPKQQSYAAIHKKEREDNIHSEAQYSQDTDDSFEEIEAQVKEHFNQNNFNHQNKKTINNAGNSNEPTILKVKKQKKPFTASALKNLIGTPQKRTNKTQKITNTTNEETVVETQKRIVRASKPTKRIAPASKRSPKRSPKRSQKRAKEPRISPKTSQRSPTIENRNKVQISPKRVINSRSKSTIRRKTHHRKVVASKPSKHVEASSHYKKQRFRTPQNGRSKRMINPAAIENDDSSSYQYLQRNSERSNHQQQQYQQPQYQQSQCQQPQSYQEHRNHMYEQEEEINNREKTKLIMKPTRQRVTVRSYEEFEEEEKENIKQPTYSNQPIPTSSYAAMNKNTKSDSRESPDHHDLLHSGEGSYQKQFRRKKDFKPYSLEDYKNQQLKNKRYDRLGGLGADLSNPELEKKRAKQERMKAYAAQVKQENTNLNVVHDSVDPKLIEKKKRKKKQISSKRARMMAFAKRVKPPKKKQIKPTPAASQAAVASKPANVSYNDVNVSDEDSDDFFGDEDETEDVPSHDSDLRRLEMLHQQDTEWLASLQA